MLLRLGVSAPRDQTLLAGAFALELVDKERCTSSVMFLGSIPQRRYGHRLGLNMTERDPQIVLVARDGNFNYHKFAGAVNAIRAGAELMAANPDLALPTRGGCLFPETGAPLRLKPHEAVTIRDNPKTYGAGALNIDIGVGYVKVDPRNHLASLDLL